MPFNIKTFKAQVLKSGFVQTNKYDIQITPSLQSKLFNSVIQTGDGRSITFSGLGNSLVDRCVSATLPGLTLRTSDVNRFGVGVLEKMPFSAGYTDIDLTFICDKQGDCYKFWYAWLNQIFSSVGLESPSVVSTVNTPGRSFYTVEYKEYYSSVITIKVYNNSGDESIKYSLYQAFPISINDTPISWQDNNNLVKLTTKITFREWSLGEGNVVVQGPVRVNQAAPNGGITG